MADSNVPITAGVGTPIDTFTQADGNHRQAVVLGDPVSAAVAGVADGRLAVAVPSSLLVVTATGAAGALATLTLPSAGAGLFHYITQLEITLFNSAARTGSATPVLVTSTNLNGNPTFNFPSAGAIGTVDRYLLSPALPMKSMAAATATTVVAPATTGILWRINAFYYAAS